MWSDYHWHFDYSRLAKDTGFTFEKSIYPFDKNKICMIDLDRVIQDVDVGTVEKFVSTIVHYNVETSEHFGVLDQNFLKIFRLSQLAVQYLLFCKKYLDNTVTLLKDEMKNIKNENKELRLFNDELKQHTDKLLLKLKVRENQPPGSFKCDECYKVFSSAEYLASHMERRHSEKENIKNLDIELEIKEIKQKLNNTEKLIKSEELNPKLEDSLNKNYSKVSELLINFESLKSQVEHDFQALQSHKDFEEIYSRIIKETVDNLKNYLNKAVVIKDCEKRNSVTQTEPIISEEKLEKIVQVDNISSQEKQSAQSYQFEEILSIQKQMQQNYENLTNTTGSSLKNIEFQMQSLKDKLQELELEKQIEQKNVSTQNLQVEISKVTKSVNTNEYDKEIVIEAQNSNKPKENKTRDCTFSSSKTRYDDLDRIDILEDEIDDKKTEKVKDILNNRSMYKIEDSEESESSSDESEIMATQKQKSVSTLAERSLTSLKRSSLSSEVTDKLKKEMHKLLNQKITELGISPEWTGIPKQTYHKTMEIINHQTNLIKKVLPNFQSTKKNILDKLDEEMKHKKVKTKTKRKSRNKFTAKNVSQPIGTKRPQSVSKIEIKNRKIFETDSSSDENSKNVKKFQSSIKISAPYSAVIEELKQSHKSEGNILTVRSLQSKTSDDDKNEDKKEWKGVLKRYPSIVGLLPKKKVLFDLETKTKIEESTLMIKNVGDGSTTSILSSFSDLSEEEESSENEQNKIEEIVDLSDSDFNLNESYLNK